MRAASGLRRSGMRPSRLAGVASALTVGVTGTVGRPATAGPGRGREVIVPRVASVELIAGREADLGLMAIVREGVQARVISARTGISR